MPDFSSALYLGLRHPSDDLGSWTRLTTGYPAALAPPPGAERVARALAGLQGCERGILAPSTLHLFWDLFGILAAEPIAIHLDAGTYPIARWGAERTCGRQVPLAVFAHHEPDALRRQLRRAGRRRPVVVADGFCPACGTGAPLHDYRDLVRRAGGLLVLDDTQALGILGAEPGPGAPSGRGGGGSLRHTGVHGPEVLVVSSLAKAFGVPAAALCGSIRRVGRFETHSETRVHCSPVSAVVVRAAERALALNRSEGDARRLRLAALVQRFRTGLRRAGIDVVGGLFPVQTLGQVQDGAALALHDRLLRCGVRGVLHRSRKRSPARLSFLIAASHTPAQIDAAVDAVVRNITTLELRRFPCHSNLSAAAGG